MNLTGEQKELHFLVAYAAVARGRACWWLQWQAVTYGSGPDGTDDRFVRGRLERGRRPKLPTSPPRMPGAGASAAPCSR